MDKATIEIRQRTTSEESYALEKELKRIVGSAGSVHVNRRRRCDGCDKFMVIGEKFKGEGMNEYCSECGKGKRGEWKTNEVA